MMRFARVAVLAVAGAGLVWSLQAAPPERPTTQPATRPSAEDVMRELLNQRQEGPVIAPTRRPVANPSSAPPANPAVIGVAPGAEAPKLRREGEFIVSRRGRLIRGTTGGQMLFVFDADSQFAAEPPVIMVPCQMLQNMENLVQERGDRLVFVVSGQVLTYRGANYLLPTLMKPDIDRGNLQH